MKARFLFAFIPISLLLCSVSPLLAQDLGPQFVNIADGIYVESTTRPNDERPAANCSIILTQEGPILINSGRTPVDARLVEAAIRKLTPLPVRFIINTEPDLDDTSNNFIFSPPGIVIAQAGTADAMLNADTAQRIPQLLEQSPEMREAAQGDQLIIPQIEFYDQMALRLGERTLYMMAIKNVHNDVDTAVWLPFDRVLFAAAAFSPNSFPPLRPVIYASDIVKGLKFMKGLEPLVVVPTHGAPGTGKLLDDALAFWARLIDQVSKMAKDGKSLSQIADELRTPENASWAPQDERLEEYIDAAYRSVVKGN